MKKVEYTDSIHDLANSHNELMDHLTKVGTRAERPSNPAIGMMYFDTNLGLPIWWNGTAWINATGALV
ncbi:hypothetical protein [Bacillus phage SP8]|nr:hypothetical protein [Bacillus phage SP8]